MAAPVNAAITFDPESFATRGPKLMGRHAAGEGFLRAFVRHGGARPLYGYCERRSTAEAFGRACLELGAEPGAARWISPERIGQLAEPGTLYVPGPNTGPFAWRRERVGRRAFSLCGVTHTISSQRAMDSLAEWQSAPLQPWDGLICTSRAVLDSVRRLWGANAEYLRERFGARTLPAPSLAQIPLGVDCDAFAPDAALRRAWRERLGIGEREVAFLFMGRLSFHAKANPLPMFAGLGEAAARAAGRLHLVLAGWFPNAQVEARFRDAARELCPAVALHVLDGRAPEPRRAVWQLADAFVSLPDNIQETFGLTPVEAMAAGLPSVVSDWDGYRGTVRHGEDGFRVPTVMPAPPAGAPLAARHESGRDDYDRYVGYASQFIAVDARATARHCAQLAADPALRARMGAAARARARTAFDWRVVIAAYQAFWGELAERRRAAPAAAARPDPRRPDPFALFAGYESLVLGAATRLALVPGASPERLRAAAASPLVAFGRAVHPAQELCRGILDRLAAGPCALGDLVPPERGGPPALQRAVAWLCKLGFVEAVEARVREDPPHQAGA